MGEQYEHVGKYLDGLNEGHLVSCEPIYFSPHLLSLWFVNLSILPFIFIFSYLSPSCPPSLSLSLLSFLPPYLSPIYLSLFLFPSSFLPSYLSFSLLSLCHSPSLVSLLPLFLPNPQPPSLSKTIVRYLFFIVWLFYLSGNIWKVSKHFKYEQYDVDVSRRCF